MYFNAVIGIVLISSTFLESLWVIGLYSPNHVLYRKYVLISIVALICGYFDPKKLRARPPNKAVTPL